LICRDNILILSETNLLAKDAWDGNEEGSDKQGSHDGESEDPLEGDSSDEELVNTERSTDDAKSKTHGIVLVDDKEEPSIN